MRKRVDENTGRQIRQITDLAEGCRVPYFKFRRHLPGGLILAWGNHSSGNLVALDPEGGDVQPIAGRFDKWLNLRESDGKAWFYHEQPNREIVAVDLPAGSQEVIGRIPEDAPGTPVVITCDGRTVILNEGHIDVTVTPSECSPDAPRPALDVEGFWYHFCTPRHGTLWSYNLDTHALIKLDENDRLLPFYEDPSPVDPTLFKYSWNHVGIYDQRIWTIRVDGSEKRMIRRQEKREWTHHEFWWPDGQYIGYKYLDRRNDPTIHEIPWGEYAPVPLHLCLANLEGVEIYKSDPLECYHSHISVSPDGTWVCGEGTDGHSFAYAAPFSISNTKVDFKPYATIHTPYVAVTAQGVETGFSADNKWLTFNDTIDGVMQVCAVEVDI